MFLTCHIHIQSELNYSCLNVKELYAQKSYFIIRLLLLIEPITIKI